jgi:anti-sigma regulatory factor (Ser/Thr protein kinase)
MPLTAIGELTASFHLLPEPAQVPHARDQTVKAIFAWGLGNHADLAELIVSELVTNAIRHGDGPIQVRLSYAVGDLSVEVHDDGAGRPFRRQATPEDDCGRAWSCSTASSPCTAGGAV